MVAETNGTGSKLMAALITAKKKFKPLVKNKINPYFKSRYADLEAVHGAVDEALLESGLTIMQPMGFDEQGHYFIKTVLEHVSGESKESKYPLPGGLEPQKFAAAITYGRRVSLTALLGIAAEDDDDGEATAGRVHEPQAEKAAQKKDAPKKDDPKPEPKKDVSWKGTVSAVEEIKAKLWKVTGGDTSTFATSTPEHRVFAEAASKSLITVEITYRLNSVGSKIIETIKEAKK